MDDLLAQFLADGEKLMVNVPLDFFENYTSEESKAPNGIHIVWFIAWCRTNDLLSPEFAGAIADYLKSPVQATLSFRDFCDQYTGGSLRPEHLSDRCAEFARRYYGTGWTHRYLVDLEMLFPAVEAFDQLVDSPGNLEAANRMLSQRWAEFRGE